MLQQALRVIHHKSKDVRCGQRELRCCCTTDLALRTRSALSVFYSVSALANSTEVDNTLQHEYDNQCARRPDRASPYLRRQPAHAVPALHHVYAFKRTLLFTVRVAAIITGQHVSGRINTLKFNARPMPAFHPLPDFHKSPSLTVTISALVWRCVLLSLGSACVRR